MNTALHLKIQHSGWNKAATYYDGLWKNQLKSAHDLLLAMAHLQSGEMVLEVACGSGLVTFPVARAVGPGGQVTATDISEEMLEIAQKEAYKKDLKNVRFQQMNAEDMSTYDQSFDVILCALGLMYVPEPCKALSEMFRVLKPGGRAIVLVWGARKNCGWAEIFPIVDKRVSTDVCPLFFQQGTGQTLLHSFQTAGFSDTEEKRLSSFLHYDNAEDVCDAMFVGGPVALAWKHFDEQTRKSAREEYLTSLKPYRKGESYKVPAEFVVVNGTRKDKV